MQKNKVLRQRYKNYNLGVSYTGILGISTTGSVEEVTKYTDINQGDAPRNIYIMKYNNDGFRADRPDDYVESSEDEFEKYSYRNFNDDVNFRGVTEINLPLGVNISRILYVFEWDNRNKKYILKKNHLKISGDNKKPILQHIFEPVTKYSEISHNDDIKLVTKIKRIEDKLYSKKLFDGLE